MLLHCNIYAFTSQYHNFLIPISLSSSFCSIFPSPPFRKHSAPCVSAIFHFSLKEKVTLILHSFFILHLEEHNNPPTPTLL